MVVAAHAVGLYALMQWSGSHEAERLTTREVAAPVYLTWIAPAAPSTSSTTPPLVEPLPLRRPAARPLPLPLPLHPPTPVLAAVAGLDLPPQAAPIASDAPVMSSEPVTTVSGEASAARSGSVASVPAEPPASLSAVAAPTAAPRTVNARDVGYLTPPRLSYPPLSRRLGEEGRVTLRVLVDEAGRPGEIHVGTSSGYPRLDDAAVQAARVARFRPYLVDGVAQRVWVLLPIAFSLDAG